MLPGRGLLVAFILVAVTGVAGAVTPGDDASPAASPASSADTGQHTTAREALRRASRFATGRGAPRDEVRAVKWFRRAAELGLAEAQFNLGVMLQAGRGVERDPQEAANWYRRAAEQGLAAAQFNLGTMYGLGEGVERDETQAAQWLRAAAEQGLAEAQYNLALLHEHGRGVPQDPRLAMSWYQRAATQGSSPARRRLAQLRTEQPEASPAEVDTPSPAAGESVATPGTRLNLDLVLRQDAESESAAGQAPAAGAGPEAAPSVDPAPASASIQTDDAAPDTAATGSAWVRSRDPGHFTVQILAHTEQDDVSRFVRKHFPRGGAVHFGFERDGRTWYAVLAGEHRTRAEALAAAAELEAIASGGEPWVRSFRALQALF